MEQLNNRNFYFWTPNLNSKNSGYLSENFRLELFEAPRADYCNKLKTSYNTKHPRQKDQHSNIQGLEKKGNDKQLKRVPAWLLHKLSFSVS